MLNEGEYLHTMELKYTTLSGLSQVFVKTS